MAQDYRDFQNALAMALASGSSEASPSDLGLSINSDGLLCITYEEE